MNGPPGAGKSMLAQRLPSILPPLSPRELLEVSMIHSVAGPLADGALTDRRPFRAPHHSASMAALVGGGVHARPGEVSLAHHGVLFLDELPEFQPQALDSLRQPLETGEVADRARQPPRRLSGALPARRGHEPVPLRPGDRAGLRLQARSRTSAAWRNIRRASPGPLLDRIDLVDRGAGGHRRRSDPAAAGRRLGRGRRAGRARRASSRRALRRARACDGIAHQRRLPARRARGGRAAGRRRASRCCATRPTRCAFRRAASPRAEGRPHARRSRRRGRRSAASISPRRSSYRAHADRRPAMA